MTPVSRRQPGNAAASLLDPQSRATNPAGDPPNASGGFSPILTTTTHEMGPGPSTGAALSVEAFPRTPNPSRGGCANPGNLLARERLIQRREQGDRSYRTLHKIRDATHALLAAEVGHG